MQDGQLLTGPFGHLEPSLFTRQRIFTVLPAWLPLSRSAIFGIAVSSHRLVSAQGGAAMALLETRGLVKFYGRRKVVDGVSFEVSAGEVVGLLGPNGAGKTTSFRMTTGQIAPYAGSVIFD